MFRTASTSSLWHSLAFLPCSIAILMQAYCSPFFTALDLQLSFYRPLCYNSRTHSPLLQCLRTTSAILPGAHTYFVVSSFKCEGKNSCHDLIPNPCIFRNLQIHGYQFLTFSMNNFPKTISSLKSLRYF